MQTKLKIGLVKAVFYEEEIKILTRDFKKRIKELYSKNFDLEFVEMEVPGAFEIPLASKWCLEKKCDAVVGLGLVIRGETAHFDWVCKAAQEGTLQVGLEFSKPVLFGVLTTENRIQTDERISGKKGPHGAKMAEALHCMLSNVLV